jgi:hypothetical protein
LLTQLEGIHPSESNEKVTTVPNPENDQPAQPEQLQNQDATNGAVRAKNLTSHQSIHTKQHFRMVKSDRHYPIVISSQASLLAMLILMI